MHTSSRYDIFSARQSSSKKQRRKETMSHCQYCTCSLTIGDLHVVVNEEFVNRDYNDCNLCGFCHHSVGWHPQGPAARVQPRKTHSIHIGYTSGSWWENFFFLRSSARVSNLSSTETTNTFQRMKVA